MVLAIPLTSQAPAKPALNVTAQIACEVELQAASHSEGTLPTQDRGYAAWSFLLAASIVEAVTWSMPFSFGILISDYLQIPEIASQPHASTLVPLIGTLSSGIIYCSGILVYPYMSRHRTHIRPMMCLGMMLCWVSPLIASYSRKVYIYVLFQGVLYGMGGGLIYPPCILFMSEWFLKRRGLANGVLFAGTAIGGLIMPFVLPSLVEAYGLFVTLRIVSIATLVLLFPCLIFVRPRLPAMRHRVRSIGNIMASSILLRDMTWWTLVTANIFQAFAFFVPLVFVPAFSAALGLGSSLSSLSVALLNGSSAAGPVLVGLLSDHFRPWPIAFILSVLSCLCTVVLWGAIGDVVGVMLFSVIYGVVAGSWSTLWSSFVRRISRDDPALSMSMYGVLMLTRGLGNVLSTPVSTALASVQTLASSPAPDDQYSRPRQGFTLDEGRFARLIAYIGACYAVATLVSVVGWRWETGVRSASRR